MRLVFTGVGVGGSVRSLRLQTPVIGSRSALAMSVHPTYLTWRRLWQYLYSRVLLATEGNAIGRVRPDRSSVRASVFALYFEPTDL